MVVEDFLRKQLSRRAFGYVDGLPFLVFLLRTSTNYRPEIEDGMRVDIVKGMHPG